MDESIRAASYYTYFFSDFEIGRLVDFIRDIFSALFVLLYAFGQNVFDLTVDRAEVLLRPRRELIVQLLGQAQRYLLLLRHISTANRS